MPTSLQEQLQSALGSAYTVKRELGGGGMSRVFLAEERRLVLNVEAVLEGKIRRYGDNLQISASLTSAENGTEPWSQSG